MEQYIVKILSVLDVTHDVRAYRVEKPVGYRFTPGQATEVAIDKEGWRDIKWDMTLLRRKFSMGYAFTTRVLVNLLSLVEAPEVLGTDEVRSHL